MRATSDNLVLLAAALDTHAMKMPFSRNMIAATTASQNDQPYGSVLICPTLKLAPNTDTDTVINAPE